MVIEVGQRIAGGTTCNAVWLSDMLGTWSFKPVLTGSTVVCCRESDRLLEIWTEISFAMAIQAVWRVADGVCTIRAVTVDFSDLACHLVVPATILGALGFEITHVLAKRRQERVSYPGQKNLLLCVYRRKER